MGMQMHAPPAHPHDAQALSRLSLNLYDFIIMQLYSMYLYMYTLSATRAGAALAQPRRVRVLRELYRSLGLRCLGRASRDS